MEFITRHNFHIPFSFKSECKLNCNDLDRKEFFEKQLPDMGSEEIRNNLLLHIFGESHLVIFRKKANLREDFKDNKNIIKILDYMYYDQKIKDIVKCEVEISINFFYNKKYNTEKFFDFTFYDKKEFLYASNNIQEEYLYKLVNRYIMEHASRKMHETLLQFDFFDKKFYSSPNVKEIPAHLYHRYPQLLENFIGSLDINTLPGNIGNLNWEFHRISGGSKTKLETIFLLERSKKVPIYDLVLFGGISLYFAERLLLQDILAKIDTNHPEYKKIHSKLIRELFLPDDIVQDDERINQDIKFIRWHMYRAYSKYFMENIPNPILKL